MSAHRLRERAFDPEEIVIRKQAMRLACDQLQWSGATNTELKIRVAKSIVEAARSGLNEPRTLARTALDQPTIFTLMQGDGSAPLIISPGASLAQERTAGQAVTVISDAQPQLLGESAAP